MTRQRWLRFLPLKRVVFYSSTAGTSWRSPSRLISKSARFEHNQNQPSRRCQFHCYACSQQARNSLTADTASQAGIDQASIDLASVKELPASSRAHIYSNILASKDPNQIALIPALVSKISRDQMDLIDFNSLLQAVISSNPTGVIFNVRDVLEDAVEILPKGKFLSLLTTATRQLRHDYLLECLLIFQSSMLKLFGTIELIDQSDHDRFRTERQIMYELLDGMARLESKPLNDLFLNLYKHIPKEFMAEFLTLSLEMLADGKFAGGDERSRFDRVKLAEAIWQFKEAHSLHFRTLDLKSLMSFYVRHNLPQKTLEYYNLNPHLHRDDQFDILLRAHALSRDWAGMHRQFESLFGRGDLPNVRQYAIVIRAISEIARVDIVEALYRSLLMRNLEPNLSIINAVMYAYVALGKPNEVENLFSQIHEKFGLVPNRHSYLILTMAKRDARMDINAIEHLERMKKHGITVNYDDVALLMSVFKQRRDTTSALELLNWYKRQCGTSHIHVYNGLLACLVEANRYKIAKAYYDRLEQDVGLTPTIATLTVMLNGCVRFSDEEEVRYWNLERSRLQLEPDSYWNALMMRFYASKGDEDCARELLHSIPDPNVYHYNPLLKMYADKRDYVHGKALYDEMLENGIKPGFKTQAQFIRLLTRQNTNTGLGDEAELLYNAFEGVKVLDLNSNHLPRDSLSPEMTEALYPFYKRTGFYHEGAQLAMKDNLRDARDIQSLKLKLKIFAKARDFEKFEAEWPFFEQALEQSLVRIQADGSDGYVLAVPPRYRKSFWSQINGKMDSMAAQGQIDKITDMLARLESLGIELNSRNYNNLAKHYLSHDQYMLKGFRLVEDKLMQGFIQRRSQQRQSSLLPPLTVSSALRSQMRHCRSRVIELIANRNQCSSYAAEEIFDKSFRKISVYFTIVAANDY